MRHPLPPALVLVAIALSASSGRSADRPALATRPATRPATTLPTTTTTEDQIILPQSPPVVFTLVRLPGGTVDLGDRGGKSVRVDVKPIWIGRTEVTWDEYDVFWRYLDYPQTERQAARQDPSVADTRPDLPYHHPHRNWGDDGYPAGSMPCRWAKAYCAWLSKQTGHKYRLPTEAEWEYACRAGGAPAVDRAQLDKVAWYAGNSDGQTHPVAKKAANAWGLFDTLGNVAEWVIRDDGAELVAGGSFQDDARDVHPRARAARDARWDGEDPEQPAGRSWFWEGGHVGFRVVRED